MVALLDYQEEKIEEIKQDPIRMHSYMEGMCIEIGNFLNLDTYTADPNAKYNNLPLSSIATLDKLPPFTYEDILKTTKKIDVLWFNDKGFLFPKRAIEIVDSIGTLDGSLKRTFQLIEFNLDFYILCKSDHINKVELELSREPYKRVRHRYKVCSYDAIEEIYNSPISSQKNEFLKVESYF